MSQSLPLSRELCLSIAVNLVPGSSACQPHLKTRKTGYVLEFLEQVRAKRLYVGAKTSRFMANWANLTFHCTQWKWYADEFTERLQALVRLLGHRFVVHDSYTIIMRKILI